MTSFLKFYFFSIISLLFISEAFAQTSFYGLVGFGKTEIKKLEISHVNVSNTFLPNYNPNYEVGIMHNLSEKFSLKAGSGFSAYSCTVGLPKGYEPMSDDYVDKINKFYYLSFPIGIRYNPKWDFRLEAGVVNNIFLKHTYQDVQFFFNFRKYTLVPYWGFSYTFFNRLELGFTDHLYLSNFANYTNWYEQTNGIEPSVFFKYNTWNMYVSYRIRLSKPVQ